MDELTQTLIKDILEYARQCSTSEVSDEEKIRLKDHIAKYISLPNVADLFSEAEIISLKNIIKD
jgi:hypothetical protein